MKSLIEEASSISKAIEKVWTRAGKPRNFSIKIYEEPEKNFFGLTTKSAKVGIIFDEKNKTIQPERTAPIEKSQPRQEKRSHTARPNNPPAKNTTRRSQDHEVPSSAKISADAPRTSTEPLISPEMEVEIASWVKQTLQLMNLTETTFSIESSEHALKVIFTGPLSSDTHKEKNLLRSLSYLMTATLRNKFKKNLRSLKMIFIKAYE